jgi:hypothetical protein
MDHLPEPRRTVVIRDPALRQFEGGFTAIPNRILENTDISLGARMTYAMLLKYAWQKDFCWPAQERLGLDLGLKSRMIRYHLDELRKAELVDWKRQGLNRPNIYYILKLPDAPEPTEPDPRYPQRDPDRQYIATPDRQSTSAQERQPIADKEHSKKNTNIVNVNSISEPLRPNPQTDALVLEMLDVLGDRHSTGLYRRIASTVPDQLIFEVLSETKYQAHTGKIRKTRGAFFTSELMRRAKGLGYNLNLNRRELDQGSA